MKTLEPSVRAKSPDVAWAAGLFEGEGSITHDDRDLQVTLVNTDLEIVERFFEIVDRGKIYGPYTQGYRDGYTRKPRWLWVAKGDAGQDVLEILAPWLSLRRREQAREHGVILPELA